MEWDQFVGKNAHQDLQTLELIVKNQKIIQDQIIQAKVHVNRKKGLLVRNMDCSGILFVSKTIPT